MKYFTKEWYELCQKTDYHLDIRADKRAEVFSEEFFAKMYEKAEIEHIAFEEAVCNVEFDDIYPEVFDYEDLDVEMYTTEELEMMEAEYYAMRDAAKESFEVNTMTFDPISAKRTFRSIWRERIKDYEENLPPEILDAVADIRVLGLRIAASDVKKAITAFCKDNERTVKRTIRDYEKYSMKAFAKELPYFAKDFNLHDCMVISCRKDGRNIVMDIDNSGGFTDVTRVVFRDAEIICRDKPLRGAWWLHYEIYITDKGYEIHGLLKKNELVYLTVTCTDVELY